MLLSSHAAGGVHSDVVMARRVVIMINATDVVTAAKGHCPDQRREHEQTHTAHHGCQVRVLPSCNGVAVQSNAQAEC